MKETFNNPKVRVDGELVAAPLPGEDPHDTFGSDPSYDIQDGIVTSESTDEKPKAKHAPYTHEIGYAKHRDDDALGKLGVRLGTAQL